MEKTQEIFIKNLTRLMKADGRDQKDMAKSCNMSVSMLTQLRSGAKGFSVETIQGICSGLGCSPVDLFADPDNIIRTKDNLILDIQSRLTAMNYDELNVVLGYISGFSRDDMPIVKPGSKTTIAD